MGFPEPSVSGTALVTGASAGIGTAIARELASRGYAVALVARREERLRSLEAELSAEHGVVAETIACDLGEPDERDRLAGELRERGRSVEVLVNNAGFGHQADFATSPRERMVGMVRLNVEAVVDLTSRYVAGMVERGRGAVINIASTGAFQPLPGSAVYGASKAFVLSFSEALRTELRGSGVSVTAVCPGPVRTEFTAAAGLPGVEERTPGAFWMSADDVARHAVDGAARDRRVVVPGVLNQASAFAGQHSPRAVALPLIGRFWRNL
ncbi:MAG TPA: SDR family oxidoreductase [Solirubrobacterales bacterium]|nr:SDR family oxidoreductase [Solirubrobacterales bacterium]